MNKRIKVFEFGRFRLDAAECQLLLDGQVVPLQPQVFTTLVTLVENSGHLCEKGWLIEQVWGDTAVEQGGLARNISVLRKVLGDGYIQTVPRRGYRFMAEMRELREAEDEVLIAERTRASVVVEEEEIGGSEGSSRQSQFSASNHLGDRERRNVMPRLVWPRRKIVLANLSLILLALVVVRMWSPLPPPRVAAYVRITNDGHQKLALVTDGQRLYVSEMVDDKPILAQVSAAGGETVPLAVPFQDPGLDDITANGAELVVASNAGPYPFSYWLVPVAGGSPRPLGGIRAHDVHPSPDGQQVAYCVETSLYVANHDGTEARQLVSMPALYPGSAIWSPDGSRLRFNLRDPQTPANSIWEVSADGSNLHPLLPGWHEPAAEYCGRWTADGKYFIFEATRDGATQLWAMRDGASFLRRANCAPVQLTSGPVQYRSPFSSPDGKKVYAIGDQIRGEVMRYDAKSQEWVPYLSGKSIAQVGFSKDGEWIVYIAYPEATLWRSRLDGSQSQQLTFASMEVDGVSWSPDGQWIVFMGRTAGRPWKLYKVASAGGSPELLLPGDGSEAYPDWSPDGRRIVFSGSPFFERRDVGPNMLELLDLTTGQVSALPDSEGCFGARWSPDGRYVVAHRFDFQKLVLFDVISGKKEELAQGVLHFANWSQDGKYIYFEQWGSDTAACRIRISDHQLETVGSLKGFRRTVGPERCWSGLTPDGSLLVLRDIGSQEVYALDLQIP